MTSYRIVPHGRERWALQMRWFGLFWIRVFVMRGWDYYERLTFPSEEAAERWIRDQLAAEADERHEKVVAAQRRAHVLPREFP